MNERFTLRELRDRYPQLFYQQTWFDDEPFLDRTPRGGIALDRPPTRLLNAGVAPSQFTAPVFCIAVELATMFVVSPRHPIWEKYLWCADLDRQGQRIYVGGVKFGCGFEIHRHLHLTEDFGIPDWTQQAQSAAA